MDDEPALDAWLADPAPTRIEAFDLPGHLLLVGGGRIPDEVRQRFAQWGGAGREESRLVLIPTATARADEADYDPRGPWRELGFAEIVVLHTRDRQVADDPSFSEVLDGATAVWLGGGDQSRLAQAYAGTRVEQAIGQVLSRGGAVGGTSAGAAIASQTMIAGGRDQPRLQVGLDLLPASIVDQHFSERNRQDRLRQAVAAHPLKVGLGIDESTAVHFHQRSMRVLGQGNAHVYFAPTEHAAAVSRSLRPGQRWLDWTTFVRTAAQRGQPPFPAPSPVDSPDDGQAPSQAEDQQSEAETPTDHLPAGQMSGRVVPGGALVIVGGGGATREIWTTFVDLAGGPEARIVVLPTAVPPRNSERESGSPRSSEAAMFRRLGVQEVEVLPQIDFATVSSPDFQEKLANATGIWFGGGRQWRFVDAYHGTGAVRAMKQCLSRGGVIGGSSAGASIQGELLIRGAPVGNQIMVQDGYRRGFGFLPGVGIDQHFAQRNRFADLEGTIRRFPSILGIGIDESTALVVQGSQARVLGRGDVYFYDARQLPPADSPLPHSERPLRLQPGQQLDLKSLKVVEDATEDPTENESKEKSQEAAEELSKATWQLDFRENLQAAN